MGKTPGVGGGGWVPTWAVWEAEPLDLVFNIQGCPCGCVHWTIKLGEE